MELVNKIHELELWRENMDQDLNRIVNDLYNITYYTDPITEDEVNSYLKNNHNKYVIFKSKIKDNTYKLEGTGYDYIFKYKSSDFYRQMYKFTHKASWKCQGLRKYQTIPEYQNHVKNLGSESAHRYLHDCRYHNVKLFNKYNLDEIDKLDPEFTYIDIKLTPIEGKIINNPFKICYFEEPDDSLLSGIVLDMRSVFEILKVRRVELDPKYAKKRSIEIFKEQYNKLKRYPNLANLFLVMNAYVFDVEVPYDMKWQFHLRMAFDEHLIKHEKYFNSIDEMERLGFSTYYLYQNTQSQLELMDKIINAFNLM